MILYALIFILFEIVIDLAVWVPQTISGRCGAVTTNDLQTQAASSDDASNQAAIDAVTTSLNSAHATLSGLIVAPTPVPGA